MIKVGRNNREGTCGAKLAGITGNAGAHATAENWALEIIGSDRSFDELLGQRIVLRMELPERKGAMESELDLPGERLFESGSDEIKRLPPS